MAQEEQIYAVGEEVPESGIYQVMHYQHRLYHEAILTQGSKFPPCATCGDKVRFRVVQTANAIDADRDFRRRRAARSAR